MTQTAVWPHTKDVVLLVNPAKRKSFIWAIAILGVLIAVVVVMGKDDSPLSKWAREEDRKADAIQLAPTMEKLASQGKRDAIIWVAKNEPEHDDARLAALADAGDGEALWLQAKFKWDSDKTEAKRLIALSADAGYLPAVKLQLKVHRHRITRWE